MLRRIWILTIAVAAALAMTQGVGLCAEEGPNSGSTFTVGTSPFDWENPDNAAASDDSYTSCHVYAYSTSRYLKATGFGFNIPEGAEIDGIFVESEGWGPAFVDDSVRIVKGDGSIGSTDKAKGEQRPTSDDDSYEEYGGSEDLWGEDWTADDINSADFGFVISTINPAPISFPSYIDHIRITVYYTEAAAETPPTMHKSKVG